GRIIFCNVDPTVSEVFRASKLESLFEFVADRATALRAIQERAMTDPGEKKPVEKETPQYDRPPNPVRTGLIRLRRRGQDSGSPQHPQSDRADNPPPMRAAARLDPAQFEAVGPGSRPRNRGWFGEFARLSA